MTAGYDVVVAGAGPAGAASAALLARCGFKTVLLDRMSFPRPKACAEYMSPGVSDVLHVAGLDAVLSGCEPFPVMGMEIISPGDARLHLAYRRDGISVQAHTLRREVLDAALVDYAVRQGAELVERFTVREPEVDGGTVRGVVGTRGERREAVRGRLTIVADGNRSIVTRKLGLARPVRWPVRLGLVAHYEGRADLHGGFGQMHVTNDGYCGVAPLSSEALNVAMVVPHDALQRAGLSAAAFFDSWIERQPRLRATLADCTRIDGVRGSAPIGARARRASTAGALLVGDASGFFDPFTGEGIYRALRGAELAAEVAATALERGDTSALQLGAYDRMRNSAFRGKDAVVRLVQAFVEWPALMEYALPRITRRPETAEALAAALGDLDVAGVFLNPHTLWSALRP